MKAEWALFGVPSCFFWVGDGLHWFFRIEAAKLFS